MKISASSFLSAASAPKLASMQIRQAVTILLAIFLLNSTAQSASFLCQLAKSKTEKTICRNPELSTLDEHMAQYYAAARSALKPADSCLVNDQKNWLRSKRDTCKNADCLRNVYLRRLAELDPLQPGVTRIRHTELPSVKALVWIVPPALDRVAAPVNKQAKPLAAQGAILSEVSGGDGYVLRAKDGKRRLIVPLMFLESPTTETLASLARLGGEYQVQGYADGSGHFAPDRCVFIYRTATEW
ncbi:MAG: lysozyme inhibitor LprI family protein [Arenimonas sp.]